MAYYFPYKNFDGYTNMQKDESLLENALKHSLKPILRFYGWKNPTITIGRNQPQTSVDLDYCKNNNIDIVRRITGGRAVFHAQELTYSFICHKDFLKNGNTVINSYKEISAALILGFKELGIDLEYPTYKKIFPSNGYCMAISTGSDLSYQGKKLIGSAQCRKKNYILQHGSILLNLNRSVLSSIFNANDIDSEVLTLNEIDKSITIEKLIASLKSGFEKHFSIMFNEFDNFN